MVDAIIFTVKANSGFVGISFIGVIARVRSVKEAKRPKKKVSSLADDWYTSCLARNRHLDTC